MSESTEKTKLKPRGGNNWMKPENQLSTQEGDTSNYLYLSMELASLPPIDLQNGQAVEDRVMEFFKLHAERDTKPTVSGLGLALGLDRRRLWEIRNNKNVGSSNNPMSLPPRTVDAIKKAYQVMENLWEDYMQNGKINPVSGIFLGKNNYGYQDKTEYVLTPSSPQDTDYDAEDIKQRYLPGKALPPVEDDGEES